MAQNRTAGFDMLVQISEAELNAQVATAVAAGLLFPTSLHQPVNAFGATGTLDLNLGTPVVDLDRPRPQLGFTIPFSSSQLEITSPAHLTVPLAGTIVIVDAVQMRTTGGTTQAVLDFTAGAPNVTVTFDAATATAIGAQLGALGVTVAMAQNQMASAVQSNLVNSVQRLPLTPQIPVADDSDPITPFSIDVTTVNDTSAADRDALTFGVRTDASSGGNINAITQSFIPAGGQSVLMMSNVWLLASVIRPQLAAKLGRPITDFDVPLHLNRSVPAPGGQGTLTNLDARVEGNRIRVDGRATASGTGWSAVATFTFFIDLSISGGAINITASTPSVHTDVSLEWWVWLASAFLGGLFGGIIGAIVGAIVPAIVESIVEGMADKMASDAFANATSNIPPVPLGPIGSGITISSLILDDLELRGPIQRALGIPVKNSGHRVMSGAFSLDLDDGSIHGVNSALASIDLAWNPVTGFDTKNGAGLTVTGWSYGALGPLQLKSLPLASTHLSANAIPFSFDLPFLGVHNEIVFGVRTNRGRLAKVRAWRNLLQGNALELYWTTYDTPIPSLDIAIRWSVTGQGEGSTFIGRDFAVCTRYDVSRRATIEAWPKLVAFPVDYQWCLCGTVLEPGDGEVTVDGHTITYHLDGRYLTLDTELGAAVDCELCVSAIDARGRELFTCVPLKQGPTETKCGKGRRFIEIPPIQLIPCDPLIGIDRWEAVSSERVQQVIGRALEVGAKDVVVR